MDDRLFVPTHRDSNHLAPSATAALPPSPAGSPVKPVIDGEAGGTPPSESSIPTVGVEEHGSSCECRTCRLPTRLDTLESSENSPLKTWLAAQPLSQIAPQSLDETSYAAKIRHGGWAGIRRQVFNSLVRCGETVTRLASFARCGSDSEIWQSKVQERRADGVYENRYVVRCNCCRDRFCTPCANQRSFQIREALMRALQGKRISFITLTLSGRGESLVDLVNRLYRHFKALRNHPTWYEKIRGGAAFIEVKYNDKARRWHPHLHIICDADYVPKQDLSDAWRSISKDSFIVDVKRVENAEKVGYYVTKYASKPLNSSFLSDADKMDEAVMALKGKRLCLTFGDWYGTPLTTAEDENLADDLIDASGYERTSISFNRLVEACLEGEEWARRMATSLGLLDKILPPTPTPAPPT